MADIYLPPAFVVWLYFVGLCQDGMIRKNGSKVVNILLVKSFIWFALKTGAGEGQLGDKSFC
jgi:hypothetical protein